MKCRFGMSGIMAISIIAILSLSACSNLPVASSSNAPVPQVVDATLDVGATKVLYRDSGGLGIPVVFLHAASGKSQMWVHQIPAFTAAGYRFIAIDWRHPNPGHRFGSQSTLLIDAVLEKLNVRNVHLLGTAAGGGAAFQYALSHPQKVRSLVVANSLGIVTDAEYVSMGQRIRPSPQFGAMPVDFLELGPSYRAANPEGVARWKALAYPSIPTAPTPPAATVATSSAPRTPLGTGSNVEVTFAKLETLKMPTLLLTGDADLYIPPSVLRMFGARIKHAEMVIVPETGHSAFWEQPEIFNRTVLNFLRKN